MGVLLDWVKANAKEGANLAEFQELEGKNTIQGVKTKEEALEIIKKSMRRQMTNNLAERC